MTLAACGGSGDSGSSESPAAGGIGGVDCATGTIKAPAPALR